MRRSRRSPLLDGEIAKSGPGMGVDDAEGCLFLLESLGKECKHGVLDDVGKVAGMVSMTIIHGGLVAIEVAPGQANSFDFGSETYGNRPLHLRGHHP